MKNLPVAKMENSLLKMLCLGSLPVSIQKMLSASTDNWEGLVTTAKQIVEVSGLTSLANVINNISEESCKAEDLYRFDRIEK